VKIHYAVDGMWLETINEDMSVKSIFNGLIAVNLQSACRTVSKVFMAMNFVGGESMIYMTVRYQKRMNLSQFQAILNGVAVGVWWKIKE